MGATDEADMEARRFKEERGPANITLKELAFCSATGQPNTPLMVQSRLQITAYLYI